MKQLGLHTVLVEGADIWDCPCHGSQFNTDGGIIHGPACKTLTKYPNLDW